MQTMFVMSPMLMTIITIITSGIAIAFSALPCLVLKINFCLIKSRTPPLNTESFDFQYAFLIKLLASMLVLQHNSVVLINYTAVSF